MKSVIVVTIGWFSFITFFDWTPLWAPEGPRKVQENPSSLKKFEIGVGAYKQQNPVTQGREKGFFAYLIEEKIAVR
jgi:hypothetical protein